MSLHRARAIAIRAGERQEQNSLPAGWCGERRGLGRRQATGPSPLPSPPPGEREARNATSCMPILREPSRSRDAASHAAIVRPAPPTQHPGARRSLPFTSLPETARRSAPHDELGGDVMDDEGGALIPLYPNDFSFCSCSSLQRMQRVVTGRASRRFIEISSSHFSRSRRRKIIDWVYSLEARSISSGRSSVSKLDSSVRVFLAERSSCFFDSSSIVLNRFRSFLFKRATLVSEPPAGAVKGRAR